MKSTSIPYSKLDMIIYKQFDSFVNIARVSKMSNTRNESDLDHR